MLPGDDGGFDFIVRWKHENLTKKDIAAFQLTLTLSATDSLNRTYEVERRFDCTAAPLAANTTRASSDGTPKDPLDTDAAGNEAIADEISACLRQTIHLEDEDAGFGLAVKEGTSASPAVGVQSVVFADGTSLGRSL